MKFKIRTVWKPLLFAAVLSIVCLATLIGLKNSDYAIILFFAFSPIAFVILADILGNHRAKLLEVDDKLRMYEYRVAQLEQRTTELEERLAASESKNASILLSQLP